MERIGPDPVNLGDIDFPKQQGQTPPIARPGEVTPVEPNYTLKFKFQDELGNPLEGVPYKTVIAGQVVPLEQRHIADANSDDEGLTTIVSNQQGEAIDLYVSWAKVTDGNARHTPLTQAETDQMTAFDVVKHWALGNGGHLYFGPNSNLSREFSEGDGAKLLEELFYQKFDGNPPHLGQMDRVDYKYTWFFRAFNTNPSVQIVGTWKGHAVRTGDQVLFRATNSMTFNSLTFGRQRAETGWDWLNPEALGPKENDLDMTIEWARPLRAGVE